MKKLLVAAVAAATIATPALADGTDSTVIAANVAAVCTIDGPANNGAIALSGTTALGNVNLQCNDPQGFTASASSANSGKLVDTSGGNSPTTYDYQLGVPGVGSVSLATAQTLNSASFGANHIAIDGIAVPVSVNVTQQNGPSFAGYYSDTITWTVTAN